MSFTMEIKHERVLEEETFEAVLDRIEQKTVAFAGEESERLMWAFRVPSEDDVEVVGFTSMSPSTRGKAFAWATAINPDIAESKNWGPDDVAGKPCRVDLEVRKDAQGVEKNAVAKVKPTKKQVEVEETEDFNDLPF
jgi:hypothetical protein